MPSETKWSYVEAQTPTSISGGRAAEGISLHSQRKRKFRFARAQECIDKPCDHRPDAGFDATGAALTGGCALDGDRCGLECDLTEWHLPSFGAMPASRATRLVSCGIAYDASGKQISAFRPNPTPEPTTPLRRAQTATGSCP